MKILVIGSGGREHALVWKLAGEAGVEAVLSAPGNPGIARIARTCPIDVADVQALLDLAERERVDLTVVGPELPLDLGIVDLFSSRGLRIFGPQRAAAQLECSKVFAKDFMARHGIPTARYRVCGTAAEARGVIADGTLGFPVVVKADGLASGKGVVVAADRATANAAIASAMEERQFGDAGSRVVLEECLTGPEVSFFALCDGRRAVPLASAQDHKRIFDGDEGPNTGGMGAFAPSPLVDPALDARIMRDVVDPVMQGMNDEGHEYRGFLYVGLMLTCDGPKVIEFNVRFGDPEAQVVIPMIAGDLAAILMAAAEGALSAAPLSTTPDKYVGVVLASRDYPRSGSKGLAISGLDAAASCERVLVFHAGTTAGAGGQVLTAGGRVLTVVGRGPTYEDAIDRAYDGVSRISFDGMQYRRDIGKKALAIAKSAKIAKIARTAETYGPADTG
jgi:phosphoribosylamine--glycine ligase